MPCFGLRHHEVNAKITKQKCVRMNSSSTTYLGKQHVTQATLTDQPSRFDAHAHGKITDGSGRHRELRFSSMKKKKETLLRSPSRAEITSRTRLARSPCTALRPLEDPLGTKWQKAHERKQTFYRCPMSDRILFPPHCGKSSWPRPLPSFGGVKRTFSDGWRAAMGLTQERLWFERTWRWNAKHRAIAWASKFPHVDDDDDSCEIVDMLRFNPAMQMSAAEARSSSGVLCTSSFLLVRDKSRSISRWKIPLPDEPRRPAPSRQYPYPANLNSSRRRRRDHTRRRWQVELQAASKSHLHLHHPTPGAGARSAQFLESRVRHRNYSRQKRPIHLD